MFIKIYKEMILEISREFEFRGFLIMIRYYEL